MRLFIKLKSLKDCSYDIKYYHKLRGFFYGLQEGSELFNRHNLNGYRLFGYSNIFPITAMKTGDFRSLLVSCPNADWIDWLRGRLERWKESGKPVNIGEMQFSIEMVKCIASKVNSKAVLTTGTPIILRIPASCYHKYGIASKRPFEYWRPTYDFNAFLKQMNDNLIKKYNQYYNEKVKDLYLFEEFQFKKDVCVHHVEKGVEILAIGTLWEFKFNHLSELQRKVLQLGLDSGFGELNSSGFGFMNVVKQ